MIRCELTQVEVKNNNSNKKIILKKHKPKSNKDILVEEQTLDKITKDLDKLSINSSENVKLDIFTENKIENTSIEDIEYENHYVSFSIIDIKQLNEIKDLDMIYFLISSLLIKNNNTLHTYKIDYEPNYKFKKSIRERVIQDFNFKNKDISTIKSVKRNKNYHYYIVIIEAPSKRISQYKNDYDINKNNFYWKNNLNLYRPCSFSIDNSIVYSNLLSQKFIDYKLYSDECDNYITIKDVYKTIALSA